MTSAGLAMRFTRSDNAPPAAASIVKTRDIPSGDSALTIYGATG